MWMIAVVDPFNAQLTSYRLQYDRWETFRRTDVALWSAFEIEQDRVERKEAAEILLLGDSRVQQLVGGLYSSRSSTVRGRKFYTLAFGGASLPEQFDYFRHFRDDFPNVKTVLLGIPYTRLRPAEETAARSDRSLRYATLPLLYLSDATEALRSAKVMLGLSQVSARPASPWQRARPEELPVERPLCSDGVDISDKQLASIRGQIGAVGADKAEHFVNVELAAFIRELRADGIDVYLYVPPWPTKVRAMIDSTFGERMSRVRSALAEVAPVLDIPSVFTDQAGWADVEHVCSRAGEQLLDILLQEIQRRGANPAPSAS
ncbi:hypothetical protein MesoLjLb_57040 [Mesorhizobium sp. L-8-3]|nr:hypothetical protein MesoLjLb_57040 [Mesorhizobium sp. L-8-3]